MSDLSISSCISKLWPCVFSQDCPSKQDLQNSIHQAHKLLSAQEASYLQSLRSLRKKLSLLQDSIARRPAKAKNCKSHIRPKAKLHHVVNSQQYSVLKVSVFYIPQLLVLTWMLLSMEESWARFCFQVMKCTSGAMRALSWWVQRRGSVKNRSAGADCRPSAEVRSEAPGVGKDSLHQTWSLFQLLCGVANQPRAHMQKRVLAPKRPPTLLIDIFSEVNNITWLFTTGPALEANHWLKLEKVL